MKIYEAKDNLLTAIQLLNALKQNPNTENALKDKINEILSSFTPQVVGELKRKLKITRKKRRREARRRKERKLVAEELAEARRRQSAEVDRLFLQHQEEEAKAKV